MKPCPHCGEKIQADAVKCKFCGEWLNQKHEVIRENEPQRKKTKSNAKIWISIAGIAVVVFIIAAVGSMVDDVGDAIKNGSVSKSFFSDDKNSQQTSESNQDGVKEKKIYKSDEPVQLGYFVYRANKVKELEEIKGQFSNQKADGIYQVIALVAGNIDKEPRYIDSAMFRLVDNQNRSYMTSTDGAIAFELNVQSDTNIFLKPVNPSIVAKGALIFDVPKDAEGLMLEVSGSFGSPEKAYIDLESKVEEKDAEKVVLGVRYAPIDNKIQAENNLPYPYGALVIKGKNKGEVAVVSDSPAEKAGIKENDIILEVNGIKIDTDNNLTDVIGKYKVGDVVKFKVWQKGEEKEFWVELTEMK
jgi:hypothetical protein